MLRGSPGHPGVSSTGPRSVFPLVLVVPTRDTYVILSRPRIRVRAFGDDTQPVILNAKCRHVLGEEILANRLVLGIYPQERITLTFQTKYPGARSCLRPVTMDFYYGQNYSGPKLDAYEKVLLDCIQGDQMLFWRQDGVEVSWAFLTPILQECETCANRKERLYPYEAGSWGPAAAKKWIKLIIDEP